MERPVTRAGLPDMSRRSDIRSILVVRLKALGDIVLSLPVVSALRESFPGAKISYLCWSRYAEALSGDTGLDDVLELNERFGEQIALIARLRSRRIDFVLDLLSSPRSAVITRLTSAGLRVGMDVGRHNWCYHYVLPRAITTDGGRVMCYTLESNREIVRMLNLTGTPSAHLNGEAEALPAGSFVPQGEAGGRRSGLKIGFPAAEPEREWADAYIGSLRVDHAGLAGMVPAAKYSSKSWPTGNFIGLARILINEMNLSPIILWGPGEEDICDEIVQKAPGSIKAPATGIARLGALIKRMKLLITLDSGPKHLAVIQGIPTVTLFGPTDPHIWDPMTERHRVVYHGLQCSPCRDRDCRYNRCLADITPGEVAGTVADLLETISVEGPAGGREGGS